MKTTNFLPYTSASLEDTNHTQILENIFSFKDTLKPRQVDKNIILYGAGNLGRMAYDFFSSVGIHITSAIDIYADRQNADPFWSTKTRVMFPNQVTTKQKEECLLVSCIVTAPLISVRDELKREGWKDIAFFYDISQWYADIHPLNNGWFLGKQTAQDKADISKVFHSWSDEHSREHYLQFLAWRRARVELTSKEFPVIGGNRYFITEVMGALHDKEVFMDGGAYTGPVIPKFIETVQGSYSNIYAIEPDPENFTGLRDQQRQARVIPYQVALSDIDGVAPFASGFDLASRLHPSGRDTAEVRKLDNLRIKPSFVKLHLEGGELRALKGGLRTITECRPILAITVYHNEDGVFKTPLFLMNSLSDYRFFFRIHGYAGTGAVLYAIPKER